MSFENYRDFESIKKAGNIIRTVTVSSVEIEKGFQRYNAVREENSANYF